VGPLVLQVVVATTPHHTKDTALETTPGTREGHQHAAPLLWCASGKYFVRNGLTTVTRWAAAPICSSSRTTQNHTPKTHWRRESGIWRVGRGRDKLTLYESRNSKEKKSVTTRSLAREKTQSFVTQIHKKFRMPVFSQDQLASGNPSVVHPRGRRRGGGGGGGGVTTPHKTEYVCPRKGG